MINRTILSYGFSVLLVLLMLGLSHIVWVPVTSRAPFLFFWLAVAAAAWYGGYWPGILACVLSSVAVSYLFVRGGHVLQLHAFEIVGLAIFVAGSVVISSISRADRRRRRWFETTLSSIGDCVITTATDGKIRFLNNRAALLTGWPEAEALDRPVDQVFVVVDENHQNLTAHIVQQVIDNGQALPSQGYRTLISRTGQRLAIEHNASPLRDEREKLIGVVIIFRGVEERAATERMLKRSEEALRLALEAGEMGVWDWNIATGEVKWTGSLEKVHGLQEGSFDETIESFQKLVHPDDMSKVQKDIEVSLATGSRFSTEFRRIFPDGTVHWIGGEGKPVFDETGKPVRLIGIGLDLTSKKQAEQRAAFLAEASRLLSTTLDYQTTLQNIADLIVPQLADWCFVDLVENDKLKTVAFRFLDPALMELAKQLQQRYPPNPNSKYGPMKVVNSSRSEMMSVIPEQVLQEFAHDENHLELMRGLDMKSYLCVPLIARGRTVGSITCVFSHSGRRYTQEDLALAEDLGNRAALAIDNARLYRESELDKEVIAAQLRERDVLMREIYHRAKNNLQIISSLLKLQSNLADGAARDILTEMQNRIRSMAMIHERLYQSHSFSELDLGLYIKELAEMLHSSFSNDGARIALHVYCENIAVDIHKAIPCGLILNELITNSMKHAFPPGRSGEIRVSLQRTNARHRLQVTDNGVGLPENLDWESGNTLGLRIVTLLAKQLGGHVSVDRSTGTTFSIEF